MLNFTSVAATFRDVPKWHDHEMVLQFGVGVLEYLEEEKSAAWIDIALTQSSLVNMSAKSVPMNTAKTHPQQSEAHHSKVQGIDLQRICEDVNGLQHQGSAWQVTPMGHNHGPVISVPHSYGYPSHSLGQQIIYNPNNQPVAVGYSSAHEHWTAEHIEIIAQGVFENGKAKGGAITVLSVLRPKLEKLHHGLPCNWDKLVVRELKGWFDISNYPANALVFLDRCMHKSKGKERRRTFKKPTNPFELALVIDHEQWDQVQVYLDTQEHITTREPKIMHAMV
ncbi:hypothetical protein PILCRDRAFT_92718 [Piloderma croceum F 1598]|uniref:Uncharacterized protein n=1 Tax=Piloderma croceum (strain F 1598) TaxID=765440 RepID=A0A0C3AK21_PILCF|nr:hypothetical protein PILCRDRAFT_92718 [Piloderma croceum F 1598]